MKYKDKLAKRGDETRARKPDNGLRFPVIKVRQVDEIFYVGVVDVRDLRPVAYSELLTEDNLEKGLQRPVDPPHVTSIKKDIVAGASITDAITCCMMNGTEVVEENGRHYVVVPAKQGRFLHMDNAQHRVEAGYKAVMDDRVSKPMEFSVSFVEFESYEKSKQRRADMTTSTKRESQTVTAYMNYQIKRLAPGKMVAGDIVLRAHADTHSEIFGRVSYVHNQPKSGRGERLLFHQCIDSHGMGTLFANVPEFAAMSKDDQYAVFDTALTAWAHTNLQAWQDPSAYILSRQAGIMSFMMALQFVFKKAIQEHGVLTPDSVTSVVEEVSGRLTHNGKNQQVYLTSRYGSSFQAREDFKRVIVNALRIVIGKDEATGGKILLKLDPKIKGKQKDEIENQVFANQTVTRVADPSTEANGKLFSEIPAEAAVAAHP